MSKQKFLNNKEKKKILEILKEQYGFEKKLDYTFLMNDKNRIYIVNNEIKEFDFEKIRLNNIGLYIGELYGDEIRLSIEGSQIIGPHANTNIIEIDESQKVKWMKGQELNNDYPSLKFVIIKSGNDYLGCGKKRDDRILNYISKSRRLNHTEDF